MFSLLKFLINHRIWMFRHYDLASPVARSVFCTLFKHKQSETLMISINISKQFYRDKREMNGPKIQSQNRNALLTHFVFMNPSRVGSFVLTVFHTGIRMHGTFSRTPRLLKCIPKKINTIIFVKIETFRFFGCFAHATDGEYIVSCARNIQTEKK